MAGKISDNNVRCSFCNKAQNQVRKLIAGPAGVYICDECVDICADILEEYGAYNAGACDGGSSSVLAYNGEVINKPSTSMASTGRCLPNAWVVSKK